MTGALEEMAVLDLSSHLSGPCCAARLIDHDADVIAIKHPGEGVESAPFMPWSRNKRSLQLDLKAADARHSFRALVDGAAVLIENFCSGALSRERADFSASRTKPASKKQSAAASCVTVWISKAVRIVQRGTCDV